MESRITLIPGDGIGPEIVREAVKVLDSVADKYGHKFDYTKILMGGCSIDEYGVPLTDEAVATAKASDAVLLGAVGGNVGNSKWYDVAPNLRPEAGLLKIRKELGLFANLRPAYLYDELKAACPLKEEIIGDGFDMVIMRELTGGLYFGDRYTKEIDGLVLWYDFVEHFCFFNCARKAAEFLRMISMQNPCADFIKFWSLCKFFSIKIYSCIQQNLCAHSGRFRCFLKLESHFYVCLFLSHIFGV